MTPLTIKPVELAPTINMPHGKAWRLDLAAIRRKGGTTLPEDAAIDAWLIEAPWAHPAWHSYLLTLIHLRPIQGFAPPKLYLPLATHELILHALDPAGDRDGLVADGPGSRCRILTPANFGAQIVEVTDALARDRIRHVVELICAGTLSPDTDFTSAWIALFGDNMLKDRAR